MSALRTTPALRPGAADDGGRPEATPSVLWVRLAAAAAIISACSALVGLLAPGRIYSQETTLLADEATAQDVVTLGVAALIVVLGSAARRGSVPAYLCWFGALSFTAYNYAIYAFSVHFGPLFLPWVAVLGLSTYALGGALVSADLVAVKRWFAGRALPLASWTLVTLAVLFLLLWLREIVPDLLAGRPSTSAAKWRVPTDPVHVLDLAFFLPAVLATGLLLRRRNPLGYATAPGQMVFLILTCLPICVTPIVAGARAHEASWAVLAPISVVLVVTSLVLWRTLRRADEVVQLS